MPKVRTQEHPLMIPTVPFDKYKDKYKDHFILERSPSGVLMAKMHTKGGSLIWNLAIHRAIHQLTTDVGQDVENEVGGGGFAVSTGNSNDFDFFSGITIPKTGQTGVYPVKIVFPDKDGIGTLIMPNMVCLIKNSPNQENGKKLMDYLLSREVEKKLAWDLCAQMPLRYDVETPAHVLSINAITGMNVDYHNVAKKMEEINGFIKQWAGF